MPCRQTYEVWLIWFSFLRNPLKYINAPIYHTHKHARIIACSNNQCLLYINIHSGNRFQIGLFLDVSTRLFHGCHIKSRDHAIIAVNEHINILTHKHTIIITHAHTHKHICFRYDARQKCSLVFFFNMRTYFKACAYWRGLVETDLRWLLCWILPCVALVLRLINYANQRLHVFVQLGGNKTCLNGINQTMLDC